MEKLLALVLDGDHNLISLMNQIEGANKYCIGSGNGITFVYIKLLKRRTLHSLALLEILFKCCAEFLGVFDKLFFALLDSLFA